jgi:lipoprotein-anchoring transpeptidase ErfK/SrfK
MLPLKIIIDVQKQTLRLVQGEEVMTEFPVSTSRFGCGFEPGSNRTPTGRFQIGEKVGTDCPIGTVFKGRKPVLDPIDWANEPDLITSRILWLEGLDPENTNSRERYIYIHGTNHEDEIGRPASHGCIRMRNADIVQLFDQIDCGTQVEIL